MSLTKKCAFLTLLLSFSLWQMTKEFLKSFPGGIFVSVSVIHGSPSSLVNAFFWAPSKLVLFCPGLVFKQVYSSLATFVF